MLVLRWHVQQWHRNGRVALLELLDLNVLLTAPPRLETSVGKKWQRDVSRVRAVLVVVTRIHAEPHNIRVERTGALIGIPNLKRRLLIWMHFRLNSGHTFSLKGLHT